MWQPSDKLGGWQTMDQYPSGPRYPLVKKHHRRWPYFSASSPLKCPIFTNSNNA